MLNSPFSVRRICVSLCLLGAVSLAAGRAAEAELPPGEKLRRYVQIDSSDSSGQRSALVFVRDLLHAEGLATRWFVSPAGVPSLVARIEASSGAKGSVVLLHHADVVSAGEGWRHPPYSGALDEGIVHGRGSLDAKSLGIAHLEAFLAAHRNRDRLVRDLILVVVSDEEKGGAEGSRWLLEAHSDLFGDAVAVLGEGGINRIYGDRIAWWGIEVAQKRPLWLRVSAGGRAGHGSTLNLHTAPHRLIRALDRLLERPLEFRATPEARLYLESIAPYEIQGVKRLVANLDNVLQLPNPESKMLPGLPNFFLDTIQINVLQAGDRPNAAPETARAWIDIRMLPDTDQEQLLSDVRRRLGDQVKVEVILDAPSVEPSPADGVGFSCVAEVLSQEAPVAPAFIPGITDARYFREHGVPAYGFSPFKLGGASLKGIHGVDEQIPLAAFEDGVKTMIEVVENCTTR